MPKEPDLSLIICTCNRAGNLLQTLEALKSVNVPSALRAELIIVDNASTDGTAQIAKNFRSPNLAVRYLHEPSPGQAKARNTGLQEAAGKIVLFTDDDVRPLPGWIEGMCAPIESGQAEAVAGGVVMAPHLHRPWMEPSHRAALADTSLLSPEAVPDLVGANMAFSRAVLSKVPRFDPALGPGALGFWDDTLFGRQLVQAGFRIAHCPQVQVEHHFQEFRLKGAAFADRAQKEGRSAAYVSYHWYHDNQRHALARLLKAKLRLHALLRKKPSWEHAEGLSPTEAQARFFVSYFEQACAQKNQPRHYARQGLVKLS